jgi:formylglycine-generating enzyme required for sulfatase activity
MQDLLAAGVRPAGPRLSLCLAPRTDLELTLIPPGSFWMGTMGEESGEGLTETPRHRVTLTRGFWMGVVPFTQRQWGAVMGGNPSHYKGRERPVEKITWRHSQDCCAKMSERLGGVYRLPHESEWEYACRAGTYSLYHSGNDEDALSRAGWHGRDSREGTAPVGRLVPNAWGLHDMHGNVYEWCADRFRTFTEEDVTDPFGEGGTSHCIRGGYWGRPFLSCRSAFRDSYHEGAYGNIAGFRVVRNLDGVPPQRKE